MTITFVLHLITVCAFLVVSLALAAKLIVDAFLDYKQVTHGIQIIKERQRNGEEPDDPFGW